MVTKDDLGVRMAAWIVDSYDGAISFTDAQHQGTITTVRLQSATNPPRQPALPDPPPPRPPGATG